LPPRRNTGRSGFFDELERAVARLRQHICKIDNVKKIRAHWRRVLGPPIALSKASPSIGLGKSWSRQFPAAAPQRDNLEKQNLQRRKNFTK